MKKVKELQPSDTQELNSRTTSTAQGGPKTPQLPK